MRREKNEKSFKKIGTRYNGGNCSGKKSQVQIK